MTPNPDPIQAQLIAARRNQILDAAAKVFAAKGFHPTTIKDIAKEAGIADGTIYHYFENKSALLLAIFDRMRDDAMRDADISAVDIHDPRSFVRHFVAQPLKDFRQNNFDLFRIIMSEALVNSTLREQFYARMSAPVLHVIEPIFAQWVAEGRLRPIDTRLTVRAIESMIMGLIMQYIMGDQLLTEHWEQMPDFLTDLILNGIGGN